MARELQKKGDYQFKDLITSIYIDIDELTREFEYLRDHPTIDRCDLAKERLFEIRDKMIKLSKNVGITDGEISNILRDYTPKPNENLAGYRQKNYRR